MEELQATQEEMDRKQRAMQQRETRIQAVLDFTPDAYIIVDAAGEIVLSNHQTVDKFGYQAEALEGLHASKLFQDVNAIDMLDFLHRHTGQSFVQKFQNQQGQTFSAEVSVNTYNAQENVGYIVRFADAQHALQSEEH